MRGVRGVRGERRPENLNGAFTLSFTASIISTTCADQCPPPRKSLDNPFRPVGTEHVETLRCPPVRRLPFWDRAMARRTSLVDSTAQSASRGTASAAIPPGYSAGYRTRSSEAGCTRYRRYLLECAGGSAAGTLTERASAGRNHHKDRAT